MTLVRRCPRCKSTDIGDALIPSEGMRGGSYWAVKCFGCGRSLTNWEIVDIETDASVAKAGDRGAVKWRHRPGDNLDRMSGRDTEGMAL